jgi:hypothetical protein
VGHMDPQAQLRSIWRRVTSIAASQHGVISRRGLLRLGLSSTQIRDRVRAGYLHPLHRGVYAVGHTNLTIHGRWMAAVLAGGPSAALSHQAAASLHQLLDPPPSLPHITTATKGLKRPGIAIHSSTLTRDERTKRQNIPTTARCSPSLPVIQGAAVSRTSTQPCPSATTASAAPNRRSRTASSTPASSNGPSSTRRSRSPACASGGRVRRHSGRRPQRVAGDQLLSRAAGRRRTLPPCPPKEEADLRALGVGDR